MEQNLTVVQPMTAVEVIAQKRLIQEVMKAVMKEGTHYGKIPGCGDKPTLFKPGADCILTTFKIAAFPEIEDLSTEDEIHYRIKVKGVHMASGIVVGVGVGECSSNEEKYKWRKAVCTEEWEETAEDRRREKWARKYKSSDYHKVKQVRTNPADVANTVLKMGKKRAAVDMTLTATAASDIFAQDLEDLPEGVREGVAEGESAPLTKPKAKAPTKAKVPDYPPINTGDKISEPQRVRFFAIWKDAGKKTEDVKAYLKAKFNSEHSADITKDGYKSACAWAKEKDEEIPFA